MPAKGSALNHAPSEPATKRQLLGARVLTATYAFAGLFAFFMWLTTVGNSTTSNLVAIAFNLINIPVSHSLVSSMVLLLITRALVGRKRIGLRTVIAFQVIGTAMSLWYFVARLLAHQWPFNDWFWVWSGISAILGLAMLWWLWRLRSVFTGRLQPGALLSAVLVAISGWLIALGVGWLLLDFTPALSMVATLTRDSTLAYSLIVLPLFVREGLDAPVYLVAPEVMRATVGFDLHRGALASVERRAPCDVDAVVVPDRPQLLVAAEGLNDHENLGALYRNAAAFGCAGVVLDPTCADPFYRRSVRVSQGNVLAIATAAMGSIEDLRRAGAATVALTPRADTTLTDLDAATLGPGPVAVVVGAEGPGLCDATIDAADHRAAIPMAAGVDSLNVATAAAIALFHLQAARLPPAT